MFSLSAQRASKLGATSTLNSRRFPHEDTIVRDVCIIGGGATGTFSAIRLRDSGKTVAVVERSSRLGGHTLTYQDPVSALKTEAGLVVIRRSPVSEKYFARFSIPLIKFEPPPPAATIFVDFTTGKKVDFSPRDPSDAFAAYGAQLAKYPFLDNGFDLPDPIPEDLLLPFGHFVKKYDLSAMVLLVSKLGQGLGDLLSQPTLYVMKNFGKTALEGFATGFLVPESGDNSSLYEKALAELGSDALIGSSVVSVRRDNHSVRVVVQTPSGQKLIKAKKLLITIPPRWRTSKAGVPDNYHVTNLGVGTPESLPKLPGIYEISPTGIPDLVNLKYGSPVPLPDEDVRADVMACLSRLREAGTLQINEKPEIALFENHGPFGLAVPVSPIEGGFYKQPNKLNGHRNTFYTGAAFQAHDATLLWEYTDDLLRKHF
ncbi:FAD/NAD(P)-binding domain-protein [Diplogelasinospora grovesii]|uniref:FAD/NAD(P)-binding domain-protein n=1 Tax=Diplogelasinospora grovesii TaxID=303347 RepID=A0AAN6NBS0_9PEZI|nr:FAD/NAD(P)-binding domain-protein [Diplogelasinospora grovesii]